ncbi:unnamed protein product [Lymnaea stagnalis]|uniref:C-type lectin domain-containing protein n=1 Tax=Lymnaea stagnalis TaxID=6523 RepID=A0AAV2IMC2_LYMST
MSLLSKTVLRSLANTAQALTSRIYISSSGEGAAQKYLLLLFLMNHYVPVRCQDCTPIMANLDKFIKFDNMGTTYYTSKAHYSDAVQSAAMCKSICGHLSEIEDKKEEELVHALLKRLNYGGVLIEGTNKYDKSKWESERTLKKINYVNWCRGEPNNHLKNENCLTYMKNWACMWDIPCVYDYRAFDIHYLCEVKNT